jgi:hypothetical protein
MKNKKLYKALFELMQNNDDILLNIEEVKINTLDYTIIEYNNIEAFDERFYNLLLNMLKNMPDSFWLNDNHRLKVYTIIKEQLDEYSPAPNPYTKSKFYS